MRRVLFLILVITFFVGCASSGNLQKIKDIVYFENDGSKETISFYNIKVNDDVNLTSTTKQKVVLRSANGKINMRIDDKGRYLAVVDIDNAKSIDDEYWALRVYKLRHFKMYMFNDEVLKILSFKTKGISFCMSYLTKSDIFINSSINYYAPDGKSPVSFFSADTIFNSNRDIDIKNVVYKVFVDDTNDYNISNLQNAAKEDSKKNLESLELICHPIHMLLDIDFKAH